MKPRIKNAQLLAGLPTQLQWFPTQGDLVEPGGDIWQRVGAALGATSEGVPGTPGVWWAEGGGAEHHSAQDGPTTK